MELSIPRVDDFDVTGVGDSPAWEDCDWQELQRVGNGRLEYRTRCKSVWSDTGIYFLVDCEDTHLTCTLQEDFANLFNEDVVEVFLQPDPTQRLYLEYEISPLGYELPIMVPNDGDKFMGWRPWQYGSARVVRRAVHVTGGGAKPSASCTGWSVEILIPFALLQGLGRVPPTVGTQWRANVYRIDFDEAPPSQWAWCPDTGRRFHNYRDFGTLVFSE